LDFRPARALVQVRTSTGRCRRTYRVRRRTGSCRGGAADVRTRTCVCSGGWLKTPRSTWHACPRIPAHAQQAHTCARARSFATSASGWQQMDKQTGGQTDSTRVIHVSPRTDKTRPSDRPVCFWLTNTPRSICGYIPTNPNHTDRPTHALTHRPGRWRWSHSPQPSTSMPPPERRGRLGEGNRTPCVQ
jgi:hypothetical protein